MSALFPLGSIARWLGLIVALGLAMPSAAVADQRDARLEALFDTLVTTTDDASAARAENDIWQIWLAIDDPVARTLMAQGRLLMARGQLGNALDIFDTLVERAPEFAEAWNKRATVHYLLGNVAASVADVARVLTLEPRHFGALSGLGLLHAQRGNDKAALKAFRAALAINPRQAGARANVEALEERLEAEAGDPI